MSADIDTSRVAFEAWLHSSDCPIPAGVSNEDMRVKIARATWKASRKAAIEEAIEACRRIALSELGLAKTEPREFQPLHTAGAMIACVCGEAVMRIFK